MNRFLKWVIVPAAIALLAGCASGSASLAKRERSGMHTDAVYVATVEAIAKRRGVEVRWVNPPREADRQVARR
jgi:uncharacterized lipoprotein YajG